MTHHSTVALPGTLICHIINEFIYVFIYYALVNMFMNSVSITSEDLSNSSATVWHQDPFSFELLPDTCLVF
jgi:hypothetical protein